MSIRDHGEPRFLQPTGPRRRRPAARIRKWKRHIFRQMWDTFGSLYGDGYEERVQGFLTDALVKSLAPVAEGRYVDPTAEESEFEPAHAFYAWPDEYAAEHADSIARVDAAADLGWACGVCGSPLGGRPGSYKKNRKLDCGHYALDSVWVPYGSVIIPGGML